MVPTLSKKQVKWLRSRAHPMPVALKLGKRGVTEAVVSELEALLARDELIKVRVGRHSEIDVSELAERMGAALVARLGHTSVLYRPGAEPQLELPQS